MEDDPTNVVQSANAALNLVGTALRVASQVKNAAGGGNGVTGPGMNAPPTGPGGRPAQARIDPEREKRAYETLNYVLRTVGTRILEAKLVDAQALGRALTAATAHIEVKLFSLEANRLFQSLAHKLNDVALVNSVFTTIYFIGFLHAELASSLPNYKDTYVPLGPRIIQEMMRVAIGEDAFRENLAANLDAYRTMAATAGLLRPTDIGYSIFPDFPSLSPCRYSSKAFGDTLKSRSIFEKLFKHFEEFGFPQPLQGRDVGAIRDWRFLSGDSNSRAFEVEKADKHIGENFGRVLYWLICSAHRMPSGMAVIAYYEQHITLIKWLGSRFGYRVISAQSDLDMSGTHSQMNRKLRAVFDTWVIIMPSETYLSSKRASSAQWTQMNSGQAARTSGQVPSPAAPSTQAAIRRRPTASQFQKPQSRSSVTSSISGPSIAGSGVQNGLSVARSRSSRDSGASTLAELTSVPGTGLSVQQPFGAAVKQGSPIITSPGTLPASGASAPMQSANVASTSSPVYKPAVMPSGSSSRQSSAASLPPTKVAVGKMQPETQTATSPSWGRPVIPAPKNEPTAVPAVMGESVSGHTPSAWPAAHPATGPNISPNMPATAYPMNSTSSSSSSVISPAEVTSIYTSSTGTFHAVASIPPLDCHLTIRRKVPPPPRKVLEIAVALYDFEAEEQSDELGFKEGDTLEVIDKSKAFADEGWCKARLKGSRRIGLVPLEYLEIKEPKTPASSMVAVPEPGPAATYTIPSVNAGIQSLPQSAGAGLTTTSVDSEPTNEPTQISRPTGIPPPSPYDTSINSNIPTSTTARPDTMTATQKPSLTPQQHNASAQQSSLLQQVPGIAQEINSMLSPSGSNSSHGPPNQLPRPHFPLDQVPPNHSPNNVRPNNARPTANAPPTVNPSQLPMRPVQRPMYPQRPMAGQGPPPPNSVVAMQLANTLVPAVAQLGSSAMNMQARQSAGQPQQTQPQQEAHQQQQHLSEGQGAAAHGHEQAGTTMSTEPYADSQAGHSSAQFQQDESKVATHHQDPSANQTGNQADLTADYTNHQATQGTDHANQQTDPAVGSVTQENDSSLGHANHQAIDTGQQPCQAGEADPQVELNALQAENVGASEPGTYHTDSAAADTYGQENHHPTNGGAEHPGGQDGLHGSAEQGQSLGTVPETTFDQAAQPQIHTTEQAGQQVSQDQYGGHQEHVDISQQQAETHPQHIDQQAADQAVGQQHQGEGTTYDHPSAGGVEPQQGYMDQQGYTDQQAFSQYAEQPIAETDPFGTASYGADPDAGASPFASMALDPSVDTQQHVAMMTTTTTTTMTETQMVAVDSNADGYVDQMGYSEQTCTAYTHEEMGGYHDGGGGGGYVDQGYVDVGYDQTYDAGAGAADWGGGDYSQGEFDMGC